MKALFDTNILIDYLNGYEEAYNTIEQYKNSYISIITKMEILVGVKNNHIIINDFINKFEIIYINDQIAEIGVELRKNNGIKLPDAIIWASAKYIDGLLITRNIKDFPEHLADIKIPYKLK